MSSDDPEVVLDPSLFGLGPIDIDLEPQNAPTTKTKTKIKATSEKSPNNEIENKKEESDLLETKPKQTKGANWRIEEDEALCKSWLNTSKDAVTGTDQTKPKFWLRIHGMFVDLMDDALEAKALFRQDNGNKQFTLDHCWALLHCHHKWKQFLDEAALGGKSKGKENKLPPSSTPDPSVVDGLSSGQAQESEIEVSGRPEGSKAAKKRKHDEINISELIKSQKEMLELSRKKQQSFESFADDMVMGRDLTGMDEEALEYFKEKRKLAWERLKNMK
ncbi:hypothetical protein MJO29_014341 [Puccinia striiformis f. sp. tritici]|nr:hypothetical protein MJO29_014341 [Puccinia striiformis f. sp. tritici]